MTSEDVFQKLGDELAQRIRAQAEPAVRRFINELLTEAVKERMDLSNFDGIAQEGQGVGIKHSMATLLDNVRSVARAGSLSAVLDILTEGAGALASRAAVFTLDGERLLGWRVSGFEPEFPPARHLDYSLDEVGFVGQAVKAGEHRELVCDSVEGQGDVELGFTVLPTGRKALAVPVRVGGEVVAVVYGDDAGQGLNCDWSAALEILAHYAGYRLEVVTSARVVQLVDTETALVGSTV